jgi:uncharacterized protein YqhQ
MDDKTVSTQTSPQSGENVPAPQSRQTMAQSTTPPAQATEQKQAYGTAKTEDLRDSGLWRIILPAAVVVFCIVLFAVPLLILIPLLLTSLDPHSASRVAGINLIWVWITLIVVALGVAIVIVQGLVKIFLTQAGNYHKV